MTDLFDQLMQRQSGLVRPAAFAGTEAGGNGRCDIGKEAYVSAGGQARRAAGPTADAGGDDGIDEGAVVWPASAQYHPAIVI